MLLPRLIDWGLRSYSTAPQIWDADNGCEHEWGITLPRAIEGGGNRHGVPVEWQRPSRTANASGGNSGRFCSRCGAWRGELGLEPTPDLYVLHLVTIFREVRRILRNNGTLWLNIADSYASGKGTCFNPGGGDNSFQNVAKDAGVIPLDRGNKSTLTAAGLKPKDLCMIPARVAIALQSDGWYLRADIIWAKPNPMPESVTDRPTRSYEHIFLLTKSARYYYDADAIRETTEGKSGPYFGSKKQNGTGRGDIGRECQTEWSSRNARDVWTFLTKGFSGAHFATFPPELPRRCILAGCPAKVCSKCGAPWVNEIKKEITNRVITGTAANINREDKGLSCNADRKITILGTIPSCSCAAPSRPGVVLDPFAGSGTTLAEAKRLGCNYIGIELNPDYEKLIRRRLAAVQEPMAGLV